MCFVSVWCWFFSVVNVCWIMFRWIFVCGSGVLVCRIILMFLMLLLCVMIFFEIVKLIVNVLRLYGVYIIIVCEMLLKMSVIGYFWLMKLCVVLIVLLCVWLMGSLIVLCGLLWSLFDWVGFMSIFVDLKYGWWWLCCCLCVEVLKYFR